MTYFTNRRWNFDLRRFTSGVFAAFLMIAGHAALASQSVSRDGSAISVRNPAHALLISVASAGARLVAVGGRGVIVYSDDNGRTWQQSAVPTDETITSVAFATPLVGWAAGDRGVILHTTDGGKTWTLQLTGDQVIALMNTAATNFSTASPTDEAAARAVRRAGIFTDAGSDKPFLSVLPLSAQSAIIFGAYRMTVITKDGGKTWTDWSLHVGDPISHNIYDAAAVGSSLYLAGEAGIVLRSDDQGAGFGMLTSPDNSTMFGVLGTPKGAVITFGVAGEVFRSTDQGKTWNQANISASADLTSGINLRSGAIVVVSEDGGVFESKDDGLSFRNLGLNLGMALYGIIQAQNGDVIFVGSGGTRVEPAATFG